MRPQPKHFEILFFSPIKLDELKFLEIFNQLIEPKNSIKFYAFIFKQTESSFYNTKILLILTDQLRNRNFNFIHSAFKDLGTLHIHTPEYSKFKDTFETTFSSDPTLFSNFKPDQWSKQKADLLFLTDRIDSLEASISDLYLLISELKASLNSGAVAEQHSNLTIGTTSRPDDSLKLKKVYEKKLDHHVFMQKNGGDLLTFASAKEAAIFCKCGEPKISKAIKKGSILFNGDLFNIWKKKND